MLCFNPDTMVRLCCGHVDNLFANPHLRFQKACFVALDLLLCLQVLILWKFVAIRCIVLTTFPKVHHHTIVTNSIISIKINSNF